MPAFEGAPLYQHNVQHTSSPPDIKKIEGGGEDTSKEEQQQSDQSSEEVQTTPATPKPFPLVVLSHGLSAMRTVYCGICSDLASHGFIVASVEHRYVA